uniref:hypothetical protein n=1 Tax=Meridianimarinicoccus zhengii TaxID=2056810 RepID=UPI0013A6E5C3
MITFEVCETDLYAIAAKALRARRLFHTAALVARADLPFATRSMLDRHLETGPDALYSAPVLAVGDELLACLHDAIEQAGGAPVLCHTEDGEPYTVGGTEDGARIDAAAARLAAFLTLAWQVCDALAAEAA